MRATGPQPSPDGLFLNVDGAQIYAEWVRPRVPGKPVLVFLHDGLGSIQTMRSFPTALSDACGMGGFVYDRLGYGRSDRLDSFPTLFMEDAADRLPRVLEKAGIDDCILVGHSDGGTIALLYGATIPPGVRAVATVAAHVRVDRLTKGQIERHADMVARGDIPGWMERFHGDRAAHLMGCWADTFLHPTYDTWDISNLIAPMRCPLLSLQGSEDAYGLPDQLDWIRTAVPHADARLIDGLGHFPHVEAPEQMLEVIVPFLCP